MAVETLAFLFTDIEGSTALLTRIGDATYAAVLEDHHRIVRAGLQRFGGVEQGTQGDSFFAVFASPSSCVAAALEIQRELRAHPWAAGEEVRVRMGIHTGEVSKTSTGMVGYEVHRAARIAAVGHGGQVLVSSSTMALVQNSLPKGAALLDLGSHRLRDLGRSEVIFQLTADDLDEWFPPLRSLAPAVLTNLPEAVSSFVGRETEMAEVTSLVTESRLVTLTGTGGSGKTRLALQVAAEVLDQFNDGVWLVELAPLADPELLDSTAASVLRVREEPGRPVLDTLADVLSDRQMLVILDNCEHVLTEVARLTDVLLRSCAALCVLATSREPLGIDGERLYRVPPLSLPEPDRSHTPASAQRFDAVRLFVERAVAHLSIFEVNANNTDTVVSLCRGLDGMPLAIELAAARVESLSLGEINRRLGDRFRLLTGGRRTALPRHETLSALIDWSYELLDEREQLVLCGLSVFSGGWSLEAAEAVCSQAGLEAGDVVNILGSLVAKSLVHTEPANEDIRYRLLETIRQYAAVRLPEQFRTEQTLVRIAHAGFFLDLADEAGPRLAGRDQASWFDRIELEHDNVRAAFTFLLSEPGSGEDALRLGFALRDFWFSSYLREGAELLETALDRVKGNPCHLGASAGIVAAYLRFEQGQYQLAQARFEEVARLATSIGDPADASQAFGGLGLLALRQGDVDTAVAMTDKSLELSRSTDDQYVIGEAFNHRAAVRSARGDPNARDDAAEALARFRAVDNRLGMARTLQNLAVFELKRADLGTARRHIQECLELRRAMHGSGEFHATLFHLGLLELLEGDAESATNAFTEVLTIACRIGARPFIAFGLLGLGFCAGMTAEKNKSAILHGAADFLFETLGEALDAHLDGYRKSEHRRLRTEMGYIAFEAAYNSGLRMTQHEIVGLALAESTG